MSLYDKEKNATSDPAIAKDKKSKVKLCSNVSNLIYLTKLNMHLTENFKILIESQVIVV